MAESNEIVSLPEEPSQENAVSVCKPNARVRPISFVAPIQHVDNDAEKSCVETTNSVANNVDPIQLFQETIQDLGNPADLQNFAKSIHTLTEVLQSLQKRLPNVQQETTNEAESSTSETQEKCNRTPEKLADSKPNLAFMNELEGRLKDGSQPPPPPPPPPPPAQVPSQDPVSAEKTPEKGEQNVPIVTPPKPLDAVTAQLKAGFKLKPTEQVKKHVETEKCYEVNFKKNLKPANTRVSKTSATSEGESTVSNLPDTATQPTNPLIEQIKKNNRARRMSIVADSMNIDVPANSENERVQVPNPRMLKKRESCPANVDANKSTKDAPANIFATLKPSPLKDRNKDDVKNEAVIDRFALPFAANLRKVPNEVIPAWCKDSDDKENLECLPKPDTPEAKPKPIPELKQRPVPSAKPITSEKVQKKEENLPNLDEPVKAMQSAAPPPPPPLPPKPIENVEVDISSGDIIKSNGKQNALETLENLSVENQQGKGDRLALMASIEAFNSTKLKKIGNLAIKKSKPAESGISRGALLSQIQGFPKDKLKSVASNKGQQKKDLQSRILGSLSDNDVLKMAINDRNKALHPEDSESDTETDKEWSSEE